ncbi:MAG: hypothetical protein COS36_05310 [Candidatus Altarchaeum sp. CG03_land_8_20_14_0_80_32_618]|nr:MAG: hypothetical protein COS36_05310 [Candidatus Altarchaeum sp. CG03_land_8_20_14_0_80_32_618]
MFFIFLFYLLLLNPLESSSEPISLVFIQNSASPSYKFYCPYYHLFNFYKNFTLFFINLNPNPLYTHDVIVASC